MKKIPVSELVPGMITAENVLDFDSKVIVPKGILLTENIISRLENYSVYYVNISDENENQEKMFLQPINILPKESPAFERFYKKYKRLEERFRTSLMESTFKGISFQHQSFVTEAIELLKDDGTDVNVFEMLLAMNNENESIFYHCIDVGLMSHELAKWLNFTDKEQAMACACGLFHDVGKMMIPAKVIDKPDRLTSAEFEIMKTHTTEGYHLLQRFGDFPKPVLNAALMHHEKCDKTGYPYGLGSDEIDKFSKIVTIVDIFDAMTSNRVYRKALCPFTVIKHFEDNGLQKYEPEYVLSFLENVANSYLNHQTTLSNGLQGEVVFINKESLSTPVIKTKEEELINMQESCYQNILSLAKKNNISIESII